MMESALSSLRVHLALAALGVTVLIVLGFLLRAFVWRDAVARYRVMSWLVPAMLLLIPAQLVAFHSPPQWMRELGDGDSDAVSFIARWSSMLNTFEQPAASPVDVHSDAASSSLDAKGLDSPGSAFNLRSWIARIYLGVCGLFALNGIRHLIRIARFLQRCATVTSPEILRLWQEISPSNRIVRGIRLLQSDEIAVPACVGGFRPAIIIPAASLEACNFNHLRFALQHELYHLQRRDWIISSLQSLAIVLFWFHPFVWLFKRAIDHDREAACDALVVRATHKPHGYATALLAFCQRQPHTTLIPLLASLGSKKTLFRRLHMITHAEQSLSRSRRMLALTATLGLACSALLAQFTFAAAARNNRTDDGKSQTVEIKTITQESGVTKRVQIDAPIYERNGKLVVEQLKALGHDVQDGSITDQESLASAFKATIEKNVITAQEFNIALPEGSKIKAVISGERVAIAKEEAKSQITVSNGRVELIDVDSVRRVLLRTEPASAKLTLTATIENGEVAFVATTPDTGAKLRLEFDRTTGVPEKEEQPPHGAVRYDLQPGNDAEDVPTRLKMQWIYDVSKVRAQADAAEVQRNIDHVQFQRVLVLRPEINAASELSVRGIVLPSPITIPAPKTADE